MILEVAYLTNIEGFAGYSVRIETGRIYVSYAPFLVSLSYSSVLNILLFLREKSAVLNKQFCKCAIYTSQDRHIIASMI